MTKKMYLRGLIAQPWYNFTESIAYAITGRPIPADIDYGKKMHYGEDRLQYVNTLCKKELLGKKKPLFIYIHGGSWVSGITEMRNSYLLNWVNAGFYVCAVSYSYAPQKIFPAQLREIFAAIDFVADKADELMIDLENTVIGGESAGGYFISHVASALCDNTPLEKLKIEFRHRESIKIKAMVSHSGAFKLERLADETKPQASFPDLKMMLTTFTGMPMKELKEYFKTDEGKLLDPQITKGFPPCFLAIGVLDPLRHESTDMMRELCALHIPYKFFKGDGSISSHAWSIVTMLKKGRICLKETFDFILPYLPDYFEKVGSQWKMKA